MNEKLNRAGRRAEAKAKRLQPSFARKQRIINDQIDRQVAVITREARKNKNSNIYQPKKKNK